MEEKQLLITGFDPFGGENINPAWEAVKLLPERIGCYRLRKLEITTVFGAAAEKICAAAEGADVRIAEATYALDEQAEMAAERGHMTFSQAAGVSARAGVRTLWLAHYSQMIESPQAYLSIAQAVFPGAVCGEDGMAEIPRTLALGELSPQEENSKRSGAYDGKNGRIAAGDAGICEN